MRLWSEAGTEGRVGGDGICLRVLGVVKMAFNVVGVVLISVTSGVL